MQYDVNESYPEQLLLLALAMGIFIIKKYGHRKKIQDYRKFSR